MGRNRIDEKFAALKRAGRKAFIAYITAGDPGMRQDRGNSPGPRGIGR